jgi:hypothetical protein
MKDRSKTMFRIPACVTQSGRELAALSLVTFFVQAKKVTNNRLLNKKALFCIELKRSADLTLTKKEFSYKRKVGKGLFNKASNVQLCNS